VSNPLGRPRDEPSDIARVTAPPEVGLQFARGESKATSSLRITVPEKTDVLILRPGSRPYVGAGEVLLSLLFGVRSFQTSFTAACSEPR
jgi:hypothetical protein